MNKFEKVWNRKDETLQLCRAWKNGLNVSTGYNMSKMKNICKEENVDFDKFMTYAQRRSKEEKEKGLNQRGKQS